MIGKKLSIHGSGNIQINGSNNTILGLAYEKSKLTQSKVHQLLLMVIAALDEGGHGHDLTMEFPVGVRQKLQYNNATKYISIFQHQLIHFSTIDEVAQEIPRSEDILKQLYRMYANTATYDVDGQPLVGDGSTQLDKISEELVNLVINDLNYNPDVVTYEDIKNFVESLMMYGVWKCKVLLKPNNPEVSIASS
ncbi:hypothetical protein CVV68_17075 [Arthrobacter livingstonensis]|uniref:Uncharacterized protein n=1 Tax=Arthrobacter livingstonensis TaxID=670078 RepID=A0A2V5L3B9_9MICC|nr:hypothetical protein [Arthrobacter livingstonensis]PYI65755.1 hypothetical protein CVV68_17075 [Arthrobacter livingstonensis]